MTSMGYKPPDRALKPPIQQHDGKACVRERIFESQGAET